MRRALQASLGATNFLVGHFALPHSARKQRSVSFRVGRERRSMARMAARRIDRFKPRWRAAIIGAPTGADGQRTAAREYRLGCAWDEDMLIVTLIAEVPGVAITFEAEDFDQAFARALAISEDMAELSGHLADGVLVSLAERGSLAEIGVEMPG
ncbi:MAG TPA: hypothetical protein VE993_09580 [Stellaceae bacterium]|nr:hypothetical protein [Stellaceae bacterium]